MNKKSDQRPLMYWLQRILFLVLLLLLPSAALFTLSPTINWKVSLTYFTLISAVTLWLYRTDKIKSKKKAWRTPESTLHLLSLFGGWPAAFLSQQLFRHKTRKISFQLIYWLTVLFHQLTSFEVLSDRLILRTLLSYV